MHSLESSKELSWMRQSRGGAEVTSGEMPFVGPRVSFSSWVYALVATEASSRTRHHDTL